MEIIRVEGIPSRDGESRTVQHEDGYELTMPEFDFRVTVRFLSDELHRATLSGEVRYGNTYLLSALAQKLGAVACRDFTNGRKDEMVLIVQGAESEDAVARILTAFSQLVPEPARRLASV